MKKLTTILAAMAFAAAFTTGAYAQDKNMMDQQAMMKAWMEYMTPGDMHKMMASWDGKWDEEVTMWMDPSQPPMVSKSSVENKMIMGGRYQVGDHTGNMGDMPFEGHNMLGYDNAKKVFQSSWVDNMGTGIMNMEGKWDAANKTINFSGTMIDPVSGKPMKVREVFKIIDDNTQMMTMYDTKNGKENKTMQIKFTRK